MTHYVPLFYYPNIFPNTHLTSGPMKNTCKISAAGKHTAAVDIQRINQPWVPPWINAAAKVMTGTTHITVKHCTASIKNMGLSAAGSKSLRASFGASLLTPKNTSRNTITYSSHISLSNAKGTCPLSPPLFSETA